MKLEEKQNLERAKYFLDREIRNTYGSFMGVPIDQFEKEYVIKILMYQEQERRRFMGFDLGLVESKADDTH